MDTIEPDPHRTHSMEVVVKLTGSSRRKIVFYCRQGVIRPARDSGEDWLFDEEAVARLRHIETLRQQHRMNWAAIRTIVSLLDQVEALREELRFRR
ncbi:transcriptional regulator [Haloferula helveola]|uniref:Transcriptional regulator n=1 Tax=Haloferula helveola TaxID=490095 RepID=A0ABM7RF82_9BACT|nr:transcriptional regulator [Haloferula helveola]